jgi:hypothetical protein
MRQSAYVIENCHHNNLISLFKELIHPHSNYLGSNSVSESGEIEQDYRPLSEIVGAPTLLYALTSYPPVFVYSVVFQEFGMSGKVASTAIASTITQSHLGHGYAVINYGSDFLANLVYRLESKTADENEPKHKLYDFNKERKNGVPRVISGSSDGRIRVWEWNNYLGEIGVRAGDGSMIPAHGCRIHSIVVDERSRYLLSGDNMGEIVVWRADNRGWYQMLRKFRKDVIGHTVPVQNTNRVSLTMTQGSILLPINSTPTTNVVLNSGIMSLSMHPEKSKAQLLVMLQSPPAMKVRGRVTINPCHVTVNLNRSLIWLRIKVRAVVRAFPLHHLPLKKAIQAIHFVVQRFQQTDDLLWQVLLQVHQAKLRIKSDYGTVKLGTTLNLAFQV